MPAKVKGLVKVQKNLKKFLPDARSKLGKELKANIVDIIVEQIASGKSPVKGQNKYPKYSAEYAKQKGRSRQDVDLIASGTMLNNMIARIKAKKVVVVEFRGPSKKIASYHHNAKKGAKKGLPQRKILPSGNETFKASIMKQITAMLQRAVNAVIK